MNGAMIARIAALAIAVAAVIDPSWTRMRTVAVPVSVIHDGQSAAFVAELRRALAPEFDLSEGGTPASQATVLVRALDHPMPLPPQRGSVYVIDDPSRTSPIRIRSIDVPAAAIAGRAVTVRAGIDAPEALGDPLSIELRAGGDLVAHEERPAGHRGRIDVILKFVPARTGLMPLQLDVRSGTHAARTGAAVTVESRRLRVLVADPRPSWPSTFVRRALEEDSVFDVSAATTVSRGVAVTSGAPSPLIDSASLEGIDAIVTGTPSALSASEAARVEAFARERGGAVVLLADQDSAGVLARLTGVTWTRRVSREPVTESGLHGTLVTTDTLVPATAAASATLVAPLTREFIVGRGRIIVSGAVDAWRHRSAEGAEFGAVWRGVVADAAMAAAPPVRVTLASNRANPGELVDVEAVIRGAHAGNPITVEGWIESDGQRQALRLWPAPAPGVFSARFPASGREGIARVVVSRAAERGPVTGEAALLVAPTSPLANVPMSVPIVLMSSRDGAYVPDGSPSALKNALLSAFPEHRAPVTDHPMRYAWWIAPFTLLLGYEWRWRRQRGLK